MNASDLASYDQRQARSTRTAKRGYRGKYPDRINTVAGTKEKGVYLVITNEGKRAYFATPDCIQAGMQTSYDQVMGRNLSDLDWMQPTIEAAVARQRAGDVEHKPRVIAAPALKHDAIMLRKYAVSVDQRMLNERKIVANIFEVLKALGWSVSMVYDGDDETRVGTPLEAMELIFDLDDCHVHMTKGRTRGWFRLILGNGNDGCDLLCDYSTNLKPLDDFEPEEIVKAEVFDRELFDMLEGAESFIAGFEDDGTQVGVGDLLTALRGRIATMKGA